MSLSPTPGPRPAWGAQSGLSPARSQRPPGPAAHRAEGQRHGGPRTPTTAPGLHRVAGAPRPSGRVGSAAQDTHRRRQLQGVRSLPVLQTPPATSGLPAPTRALGARRPQPLCRASGRPPRDPPGPGCASAQSRPSRAAGATGRPASAPTLRGARHVAPAPRPDRSRPPALNLGPPRPQRRELGALLPAPAPPPGPLSALLPAPQRPLPTRDPSSPAAGSWELGRGPSPGL